MSTASLVLGVAAAGASSSAIVTAGIAGLVAVELSSGDRLAVHAREELGLEDGKRARPLQAAWASALSFTVGAALPLLAIALTPDGARVAVCVASTLVALGLLGNLGALLGGAPRLKAGGRVLVWGAIAMAVTSAIGALTGALI